MTCLQAAINAGADAVYLGVDVFNMRCGASANFAREALPEASRRCREAGVRLYLTVNTIVFEDELPKVEELLSFAKPHIDAAIVSDWAVFLACKRLGIPIHVSTQMSCSNSAAASFLKEMGAARVVLARECTLDEVSEITRKSGIEIETFVHGAICVAESGRCFLSHEAYGHSANRGQCHQPCRDEYVIQSVDRYAPREGETPREGRRFVVTPSTVLSAKDLCSLPFLDRLVRTGVASLKIEGRARNPEYVRTVVGAYRAAVDAVADGTFSQALAERLVEEVSKVFHREFSFGLFFGRPGEGQFNSGGDTRATTVKRNVGVVLHYYAKAGAAQIQVQDQPFSPGDTIQVHGPTTGVVEFTAGPLQRDGETPASAEKGMWVTVACPRVRAGDKVYRIAPRTP
jgi:putative protease